MKTITKDPGRDFYVLNLTDVQIDVSDLSGETYCMKLFKKTTNELVARTHPQLITVSGDISYGDNPEFLSVYRAFAEYIESFQIPWAVVWGNHDNQGGADRIRKIVEMFHTFPHFVYESGDSKLGDGNYVIAISENEKIIESIIMMDTHDRMQFTNENGETIEAWAKLLPQQLEWYEQIVRATGYAKSILITHIPIFVYSRAFKAAFRDTLDMNSISFKQSTDGSCWNEGYKDSFGVNYEAVSCYPENDGAFELLKKLKSTMLVLCGHDHVNCWSIRYQGIRLMYALKTGCGCYWDSGINGGTIIKIHSDGSADAEQLFVDTSVD